MMRYEDNAWRLAFRQVAEDLVLAREQKAHWARYGMYLSPSTKGLLGWANCYSLRAALAAERQAHEATRAELREAVGLLRKAESAIPLDDCPVCAVMGRDASGHRPDCRLTAFLARHPEVK